ncbi:ABC transporter permease [Frondihabitans sp. PAMC 28766]|uniref:ABC transporter permease n=1 Tax=Frondihabitans sp. PAMC 28766 TaxID=1795630 RepID=UPI00078E0595|nr:ABC transporter permease [Frondihabitans sp. PAMC 28766]AMM21385.1 ABC transporter permease [Frondihabitans sp. PAMC 28766]
MTSSIAGDTIAPSTESERSESTGRRLGALLWRRLIQIPLVLLGVSILTFWLVQVVPGDPGRNALGQFATLSQVAAWDRDNGLAGPIWLRYLHWLGGFVSGHWGTSFVYETASRPLVISYLLNSVLLGLFAFVLMVPISVVLGSIQAYREGKRSDRAITVALMAVSSVPEFVIGVILLVVFAVWVHVVPVQSGQAATGDFGQRVQVMVLPAIVLAVAYLAVLTRMVRTGTAGAITSQYHRAAVLKGLGPVSVVSRHVVRNALVPTLSLLGLYLGALLGGSAIVETLFNYPGLGALLVVAAERKDVVLLTDGVMVTGAVALVVLLLTDIGLILMDPRIRFERSAD